MQGLALPALAPSARGACTCICLPGALSVSAARLASGLLSTADIGIIVAGVMGPGLGYVAGWRSDIRRFGEERRLKASDDLRDRIDEVGATLEALSVAAVGVRSETLQHAANRAALAKALGKHQWDAVASAYRHDPTFNEAPARRVAAARKALAGFAESKRSAVRQRLGNWLAPPPSGDGV